MKRTLKRESKVLEIVRREAIGTGGSLFFAPGCSVTPPSEGPAGTRSVSKAPSSRVRLLARVTHSVRGASQHRLRETVVTDGHRVGPGGLASRLCPTSATR